MKRKTMMLCAALIALLATGCATDTALRDGMDQGTATIRRERREWSRILAGDNDGDGRVTDADGPVDPSRLPDLRSKTTQTRDSWLRARETAEAEYESLVQQSRARDSQKFFGLPTTQR